MATDSAMLRLTAPPHPQTAYNDFFLKNEDSDVLQGNPVKQTMQYCLDCSFCIFKNINAEIIASS